MFARRVFTTILQKVRKARIHNLFAKRVFYNNFYNVHRDTLFPRSYSFINNRHTQGELGSGFTFISSLQFFYYVLRLSASNGSYLYFLLLWQRNSFYFLLGRKGDWGYLYFYSHQGGVFKGLLSSRVYLYC